MTQTLQAPPQWSPDGRWWWDGVRWWPRDLLAAAKPPRRHPLWSWIAAVAAMLPVVWIVFVEVVGLTPMHPPRWTQLEYAQDATGSGPCAATDAVTLNLRNLDGTGTSLVGCTTARPTCYANTVDGHKWLVVDTELRNASANLVVNRFLIAMRLPPSGGVDITHYDIASDAGRVWAEAYNTTARVLFNPSYDLYWSGSSGSIDPLQSDLSGVSGTIRAHLGGVGHSGTIDATKAAIDIEGSWSCAIR